MQWQEYFHEGKDGMFYSTRPSRVEWNIPSFTEWGNGTFYSISRLRLFPRLKQDWNHYSVLPDLPTPTRQSDRTARII